MTGTLAELVAAAGVFLATHVGLSAPGPRARLVGALGRPAFLGLYAVLLLGHEWVIGRPAWPG